MPFNYFDNLAGSRPLEPVERLWRIYMRANPKFKIPKLGPSRDVETEIEKRLKEWEEEHKDETPSSPEKEKENSQIPEEVEKDLEVDKHKLLTDTVIDELKPKIKQILDGIFKNLIEKEGEEKAKNFVFEERKMIVNLRSEQLEQKPIKRKSCPTTPNELKDISKLKIPKLSSFDNESTSPESSNDDEKIEVDENKPETSEKENDVELKDSQYSPVELLNKYMKRLEDLEESESKEDAMLNDFINELASLRNVKTGVSEREKKVIREKINNLRKSLKERKEKIRKILMYIPALRREAAIENSQEWIDLFEKQAENFLKDRSDCTTSVE